MAAAPRVMAAARSGRSFPRWSSRSRQTASGRSTTFRCCSVCIPTRPTGGADLMSIVLGENQYGKAETRLVRIYRDSERHEIRDLNVSTALRGDFGAAYLTGDQSKVLPTDTQKNTCFAFAKEHGVAEIEDYALALAAHFTDDIESVTRARVDV